MGDGGTAGASEEPLLRAPTTWRCSTSTGSSTSVARRSPGAPSHLAGRGRPACALAFVTNNASRPPRRWPRTCASSGWRPRPTTWSPRPRRRRGCCASGSARVRGWRCSAARGLEAALRGGGLVPVASPTRTRSRWCRGYGPDVLWRDIMRAAVLVRDGLPWVASNTDLTIPTAYGTAPGHGVLVGDASDFAGVRARRGRQARAAAAGRDGPAGGGRAAADGGRPAGHRHRGRPRRRGRLACW